MAELTLEQQFHYHLFSGTIDEMPLGDVVEHLMMARRLHALRNSAMEEMRRGRMVLIMDLTLDEKLTFELDQRKYLTWDVAVVRELLRDAVKGLMIQEQELKAAVIAAF
jgi:hypothetical protein